MTVYLLDTGPLSALFLHRTWAVERFQPLLESEAAVTSILVFGEIVEYLRSLRDFGHRYGEFLAMTEYVYPYEITLGIASRYSLIRRQLRPPHGPGLIGDIDTLIAATAFENDLTLVTMDSDFLRVPGLQVELVDRRTTRR